MEMVKSKRVIQQIEMCHRHAYGDLHQRNDTEIMVDLEA